MLEIKHRGMLDALPSYTPGRNPQDVVQSLAPGEAAAPAEIVKLSSNESPFPPPAGVLHAVQEACAQANRYPDFHKVAVATALAERLGVDAEQIVVDNGSGSLIRHLCLVTSTEANEIVEPQPSFRSYSLGAAVAGATSIAIPLADHVVDTEAMLAAIGPRTSLVFICNPNNPTGTTMRRAALDAFMEAVPKDVLVVIDEAYHEFVTDPDSPSGIDYLKRYHNIAVLRTFSKAYGLAGFRVGYCVSRVELADLLRKVCSDFSVSSLAQAAALAALEPAAEKEALDRVDRIIAERTRITAELEAIGVPVVPSQSNFILLPIGSHSAPAAAEFERHGVILRSFGEDGLRVTIGLESDNDKFLAAARVVLGDVAVARP